MAVYKGDTEEEINATDAYNQALQTLAESSVPLAGGGDYAATIRKNWPLGQMQFARGGYADGGETDPMMDEDIEGALRLARQNPDYAPFAQTQISGVRGEPNTYSYPSGEAQRFRPMPPQASEADVRAYMDASGTNPMEFAPSTSGPQNQMPYGEQMRNVREYVQPTAQGAKDAAALALSYGLGAPADVGNLVLQARDVLSGRPVDTSHPSFGSEAFRERAQRAGSLSQDPSTGSEVMGMLGGFFTDPAAAVSVLGKAGATKLAMAAIPGRAAKMEPEVALAKRELASTPKQTYELTGALAPESPPVRGQTRQELEQMQASTLSPQDLDKLNDLKAKNPEFANAAAHLMPDELKTLISNPNQIEAMNRILDVIPNAAHMSSIAKAGAPKQGWYRGSTQALIDVFGQEDAPRFAALLAATSPQTSVEMNLLNSLNIWKNWTAAGRPTDPTSIKAIMGQSVSGLKGEDSILGAWLNNTSRALSAEDPLKVTLSGPKVNSFFRNLADDVYRVTNDAWMSNATNIDQDILRISPTAKQLSEGNPGYSPGYLALNARQREAGDIAKMFPNEVQETAWSVAMPLMESQSRLGLPAREILQRGLLTPEMIRGTPDFSSLLATEPRYRQILEQSGYGPQVSAMKPYEFPRTLPTMTTADQNNLMKTAETLENLRDLRSREKRALVSGFRPNPETAFAYATGEGVTGLGTGHLENTINEPLGARSHFTGRISQAFQDPQGMDILHKGLGLKPIATRSTTGAFQPTPTSPIEINPGFAAGVEAPLVMRGKKQIIDPAVEQALRTAATLRGGMTAQLGSPYNAQILDEKGSNLAVQLAKKVNEESMKNVVGKYGLDRMAVADTGEGANILNWGDRFKENEMSDISDILGGKNVARTREVSNPDMNYVDLTKEWQAGVGSRQVTQRMLDELKKVGSERFASLDNNEIRNAAGDILKVYQGREAKGQTVRPDLMNMLAIVRDTGLKGLRKAMKDPDQLLPAIVSAGLAPSVYQSLYGEGSQ